MMAVAELLEPIERLVACHTDASSLKAWLAQENPSVDCREEACTDGKMKMERDVLADVGDDIFVRRGTRNPDGSFKRVDDQCGDEEAATGTALDAVLNATHDPGLISLRLAYLLACRVYTGMSEADALAEVREIETTELCRECGESETGLIEGLCLSCVGR